MSIGPEEPVSQSGPGEVERTELSPEELFEEILRIRDVRNLAISKAYADARETARGIATPSYDGAAAALLELLPDVLDRLRDYRHGDQAKSEEPIRLFGMTLDTNLRTAINALCVASQATGRQFDGEFLGIRFSIDPQSVPEEVWRASIRQYPTDG